MDARIALWRYCFAKSAALAERGPEGVPDMLCPMKPKSTKIWMGVDATEGWVGIQGRQQRQGAKADGRGCEGEVEILGFSRFTSKLNELSTS